MEANRWITFFIWSFMISTCWSQQVQPVSESTCQSCCREVSQFRRVLSNGLGSQAFRSRSLQITLDLDFCENEGCTGSQIDVLGSIVRCDQLGSDQSQILSCELGRDFRLLGVTSLISSAPFHKCSESGGLIESLVDAQAVQNPATASSICASCCVDLNNRFDPGTPDDFTRQTCVDTCNNNGIPCFAAASHRDRLACAIGRDFLEFGTVTLREVGRTFVCESTGTVKAPTIGITSFPSASPTTKEPTTLFPTLSPTSIPTAYEIGSFRQGDDFMVLVIGVGAGVVGCGLAFVVGCGYVKDNSASKFWGGAAPANDGKKEIGAMDSYSFLLQTPEFLSDKVPSSKFPTVSVRTTLNSNLEIQKTSASYDSPIPIKKKKQQNMLSGMIGRKSGSSFHSIFKIPEDCEVLSKDSANDSKSAHYMEDATFSKLPPPLPLRTKKQKRNISFQSWISKQSEDYPPEHRSSVDLMDLSPPVSPGRRSSAASFGGIGILTNFAGLFSLFSGSTKDKNARSVKDSETLPSLFTVRTSIRSSNLDTLEDGDDEEPIKNDDEAILDNEKSRGNNVEGELGAQMIEAADAIDISSSVIKDSEVETGEKAKKVYEIKNQNEAHHKTAEGIEKVETGDSVHINEELGTDAGLEVHDLFVPNDYEPLPETGASGERDEATNADNDYENENNNGYGEDLLEIEKDEEYVRLYLQPNRDEVERNEDRKANNDDDDIGSEDKYIGYVHTLLDQLESEDYTNHDAKNLFPIEVKEIDAEKSPSFPHLKEYDDQKSLSLPTLKENYDECLISSPEIQTAKGSNPIVKPNIAVVDGRKSLGAPMTPTTLKNRLNELWKFPPKREY